MRFLFVHQNFPGQFLHVLRHLAASGEHELIFITQENANFIAGVRKATYRGPGELNPFTHRDAQEFEHAVIRAQSVAQVAANLKALGFRPDVIIGHHGWGEMLSLGDVWPGVPSLGYYEFYYNVSGFDVNFDPEFQTSPEGLPRVRAKNTVNLLALDISNGPPIPIGRRTGSMSCRRASTLMSAARRPTRRRRHSSRANLSCRPAESLSPTSPATLNLIAASTS